MTLSRADRLALDLKARYCTTAWWSGTCVGSDAFGHHVVVVYATRHLPRGLLPCDEEGVPLRIIYV